ncbi:MAG: hypothetical protein JRJ44_01595 [Deltaproteobacteria bacterium]|nr:hypothetical protein [Deltaproteobacteria bacterium]
MMSGLSPTGVINKVAASLVVKRKYSTVEEAIWELALSSVRSKTAYYRRRIRKLEKKYGTSFDKFTAQLKSQATPAEEDDWLEWKSAQSMLDDWQKTYRNLTNESPC